MNRLHLLVLPIAFVLSSCATNNHPMARVFESSRACYLKIESRPEAQLVREQIIPRADADPAKRYELLNSNETVKDEHKKALGIYIMMDKECDLAFESGLIGSAWHKPRKELNKQLHPLYDDLLNSKISIGFFNRRLNQLFKEDTEAMMKAKQEDMANQAGNIWYYNNVINPPLGSGNIFIFQ